MQNCNQYESAPIKNGQPAIWQEVIRNLEGRIDVPTSLLHDMAERDKFGTQKYGTPLQPFNGRDPIIDAYQEALDLVVYTKQAVLESARDPKHWRISPKNPQLEMIYLSAVQCAINLRQVLDSRG